MFTTGNKQNTLNELDALFNSFLNWETINKPRFKTETDDSGLIFTMNVPGYNKNLIDVVVENDTLIIEGKSNSGDTAGFKEKFTINHKFDVSKIHAKVVDGVMTVSIPYNKEILPKQIKVKVS